MSEAPAANHRLTPLPDQLRDFVPNRPPDFHYPPITTASSTPYEQTESALSWGELFDNKQAGKEITCAAAWLPTDTEPGYAYARIGDSWGDELTNHITGFAQDLRQAQEYGLGSALRTAGIATSWLRRRGVIHTEVVHPGPVQFCENTDRAADAGIINIRFAVNSHPGKYSGVEVATSLGRDGRVLIAPFAAEPSVDDYRHVLHDMLFHAAGQMGLAKELTGRELLRGKIAYWFTKIGFLWLAKRLCYDMERQISVSDLDSCVNGEYMFGAFRPLASLSTASRLTRRHLIARRAAERAAAEDPAA